MGTFTVLGEAELVQICEAFGLGALQSFRAIAAGTINSNYALDTERGRFFVRVNEGKAERDVAWEAQLVTALAAAGVATPPPLTALDGRAYAPLPSASTTESSATASAVQTAGDASGAPGGATKWVSAFAWRDGVHLRADEVTPALATTFGAELATLHRAGLALPEAWRRRSIYDHDHLVARFDAVSRCGDSALDRAIAIIGEELAVAAEVAPIRRAATHGIIHGDLFRDNVLWGEGGAISAILDFEQASGGSLVYDLAVCINDWCWSERDSRPELDLARALVAGYQQVRPLTEADRAALPYELRASAARFTLTRITDVYLAKVANPEKDFRAFLARCEAWRGPSLGQLTSTV